MYARFFTFKAGPDRRPEVEALADQVFEFVKSQKGFISIHFVINEGQTEFGSFSLWESKDDAVAAGESIRSEIGGTLQNLVSEAPRVEVYEVYKPG
jgi:heme-degrading monooxygenase HmoA